MDGGDTRGFVSNGTSYTYPIESVAEFKIQTATYSAEFGRAGGGVINVASKSGTNEYQRRRLPSIDLIARTHNNRGTQRGQRRGLRICGLHCYWILAS